MPMPKLTEEGLTAANSILRRDMRINGIKSFESRLEQISNENPVFVEYLENTLNMLDRLIDKDGMIHVATAKQMMAVAMVQEYFAIKAAIESEELKSISEGSEVLK